MQGFSGVPYQTCPYWTLCGALYERWVSTVLHWHVSHACSPGQLPRHLTIQVGVRSIQQGAFQLSMVWHPVEHGCWQSPGWRSTPGCHWQHHGHSVILGWQEEIESNFIPYILECSAATFLVHGMAPFGWLAVSGLDPVHTVMSSRDCQGTCLYAVLWALINVCQSNVTVQAAAACSHARTCLSTQYL